jgi:hypothetical protein
LNERVERRLTWAAALVMLAYFGGLRDIPERRATVAPHGGQELPPPAPDEVRDRVLSVEVTDEQGALVVGAVVTVFVIRDGEALLAGSRLTERDGQARFSTLPRGEFRVLAEAEGRQRASTRLTLAEAPGTAKITLRRASRLAVQVIDEAERAVVGAVVEVRSADPLPFLGRSGEGGLAEFGRLGPGPWAVKASAPGFEPVSRSGVAAGLLPQRLVLRSLGALEVTVIGLDGNPVPEARIEVAGSGLWPARHAISGPDGVVRIASLPAGVYDVAASLGEQVSPTSIGTPVRRGEPTKIRLELGKGRKVAVKVVEGDADQGRPVPGAQLVLAEDGLSSFPREALTDDQGQATIGPIGARGGVLGVRAEGFVPRSGVRVPASQDGPVVVSLVRGARLVGEVVDSHDFPIVGATIEVIGVDLQGMPVDETPDRVGFRDAHFSWAMAAPVGLIPAGELGVMPGVIPPIPRGRVAGGGALTGLASAEPWVSGSDGRFRAGPVPPGRLRALVRHPGFVEGVSDAVTLAPGGEGRVKVVLRAGGTLEGRLRDVSGRPVAGARVEIAAVHGSVVRSAMTAEDGTFGFAAVPGEVSVSVSRPDALDEVALKKQVALGEGERKEIELTLPEARDPMKVLVTDDRGYPLDAVQVTALSLSTDSPLRATRFTRADGQATLPDAAGLALRLEVSLNGYAPSIQTLERSATEVTVKLAKGATIEGEVTERGGRDSLPGAEVSLTIGGLVRRARTDAEGHFLLRDLPPGAGRLVVSAKGYARVERELQIGDATRAAPIERIDLAEAGEVEGEVVDKDGDPVVGARVARGTAPAFVPIGPLPPGLAVTDAQGRFVLGDLPEGEITLEAFAPDRGRGHEKARVLAGRRLRGVRIELSGEVTAADPPSSGGVAVTLAESTENGQKRISLKSVMPGSEAERAGLAENDVIARIDERAPTSLEDARRHLSGPLGDDVLVEVLREGEIHKLRVARERVRR